MDFVFTLEVHERTIFFGILCRLQKYVSRAAAEPRLRRSHELVSVEDRPSMLYYLCACTADQYAGLVRLFREVNERLDAENPAAPEPGGRVRSRTENNSLPASLRALDPETREARAAPPTLGGRLDALRDADVGARVLGLFEHLLHAEIDAESDAAESQKYFTDIELRAIDYATAAIRPELVPAEAPAAEPVEAPPKRRRGKRRSSRAGRRAREQAAALDASVSRSIFSGSVLCAPITLDCQDSTPRSALDCASP